MTAEFLSSIAGIVLSLLFSYVPKMSTWYAGLDGQYKRLGMVALLLLTSLGVFGLSCANLASYFTCDQAGALELLKIFIAALIANQVAYTISPETSAVKAAKAARL